MQSPAFAQGHDAPKVQDGVQQGFLRGGLDAESGVEFLFWRWCSWRVIAYSVVEILDAFQCNAQCATRVGLHFGVQIRYRCIVVAQHGVGFGAHKQGEVGCKHGVGRVRIPYSCLHIGVFEGVRNLVDEVLRQAVVAPDGVAEVAAAPPRTLRLQVFIF